MIILDVILPKKHGFKVCRGLKPDYTYNFFSHIPVLVLSAVRESSSRRCCEIETSSDLGADDYLEKPTSSPLLLNEFNKIPTEKGSKICH